MGNLGFMYPQCELVLLEFEIRGGLQRTVKATNTRSQDNFSRLPNQRQCGSFIFFHRIHLLSVLVWSFKLVAYATPNLAEGDAASARLCSHNSSKMMFRSWESLQSSPAESRSRRERTLARSTNPRSTTCSCRL